MAANSTTAVVLIRYKQQLNELDKAKIHTEFQQKGFQFSKKFPRYLSEVWRYSKVTKSSQTLAKVIEEKCADLKVKFPVVEICEIENAAIPNEPATDEEKDLILNKASVSLHETKSSSSENEAQSKKEETTSESKPCQLLQDLNGQSELSRGLSTFWAHEYVGIDLAYKNWEKWNKNESQFAQGKESRAQKSRMLIIDTSEKGLHGISVRNVIAMNTPEGAAVSPQGAQRIDYFDLARSQSEDGGKLLEALDKHAEGADVVNVSMGNFAKSSYMAMEDFQKKHNSLFVVSSGNEYPDFEANKNEFSKDIIYVGSLKPNGTLSDFSSEFNGVSVTAPSNYELVGHTAEKLFGGTSGAAPLVSSALGMAKSVLPKLSIQETKKLLSLTNLPTWNAFEVEPKQNGSGTLNAAGLVNAAIEIRKTCGIDYSVSCFHDYLAKKLTQKSEIDENLMAQIRDSFGCSEKGDGVQPKKQSTCEESKALFTKLRSLAFDNPKVSPYWNAIACIHNKNGFYQNAEFYQKLAIAGWPRKSDEIVRKMIQERLRKDTSFEAERMKYLFAKDPSKYSPRTHLQVALAARNLQSQMELDKIAQLPLAPAAKSVATLEKYLNRESAYREIAFKKLLEVKDDKLILDTLVKVAGNPQNSGLSEEMLLQLKDRFDEKTFRSAMKNAEKVLSPDKLALFMLAHDSTTPEAFDVLKKGLQSSNKVVQKKSNGILFKHFPKEFLESKTYWEQATDLQKMDWIAMASQRENPASLFVFLEAFRDGADVKLSKMAKDSLRLASPAFADQVLSNLVKLYPAKEVQFANLAWMRSDPWSLRLTAAALAQGSSEDAKFFRTMGSAYQYAQKKDIGEIQSFVRNSGKDTQRTVFKVVLDHVDPSKLGEFVAPFLKDRDPELRELALLKLTGSPPDEISPMQKLKFSGVALADPDPKLKNLGYALLREVKIENLEQLKSEVRESNDPDLKRAALYYLETIVPMREENQKSRNEKIHSIPLPTSPWR